MKKAFTLIELLVVIAIIAILAAILFPVFAQAKVAAKKTTSVSNLKQMSTSMFLYTSDNDDLYPRNDDCVVNSSLDPQYNGFTGTPTAAQLTAKCNSGNTLGGFAWRANHYAWQKWVYPYVKNTQMFIHPSFPLIKGTNSTGTNVKSPTGFDQGEIANGYALNIAITGALNTWNCAGGVGGVGCTGPSAYRNSYVGGTQTGIPDVAGAMLFTEQWFFPVTGAMQVPGAGSLPTVTSYPPAFKEHWMAMFYKQDATANPSSSCWTNNVIDTNKVPFGVVPVGFADGHAKAIPVGDFLAKTPTFQQYTGQPLDTAFSCGLFASYYNNNINSISVPAGSYPFWGF
jgi:prepilin-type N-terminal cleavage/methylation domain-containing protein